LAASGRSPRRVGVHYELHRSEQTTLYRLVQQHTAGLIAQAEASRGGELPQFVKDEFDAFLESGILAHGFLRLHCCDFGRDKLVASGREHCGFRRAGGRTWRRPRRSWSTTSLPPCPCGDGCCRLHLLRLLSESRPELLAPVLKGC
jgi:hypothetical protein